MNQQHQHQSVGCLKGIVHPKRKILSSFTHPQVVPNLYECLCSAEHKGRYSEECGKQSSSEAPLTSIVFFIFSYGSQWCPKTAWLQTFFKISSFVFSRTNKFIQVWNKHHFKLIDATLFNPEVGFYMNCFYLDCCLELGAIPVSAVLLVRCATTFRTCIKCSSLRARSYFNVFTLTC